MLRYGLYTAAWGLLLLGTYSMVSGYASARMDSDGNFVDGSLMMPMMALLACLGAAAGCVIFAERARR